MSDILSIQPARATIGVVFDPYDDDGSLATRLGVPDAVVENVMAEVPAGYVPTDTAYIADVLLRMGQHVRSANGASDVMAEVKIWQTYGGTHGKATRDRVLYVNAYDHDATVFVAYVQTAPHGPGSEGPGTWRWIIDAMTINEMKNRFPY